MLTLNQLIKISNIPPKTKEDAIKNIDSLNEDQKARLSQVCWESIYLMYENKARLEYDRMLEEMASGEKKYSPDDFNAIDDKIIADLLSRLDTTETQEELTKVKGELREVLNKPH